MKAKGKARERVKAKAIVQTPEELMAEAEKVIEQTEKTLEEPDITGKDPL